MTKYFIYSPQCVRLLLTKRSWYTKLTRFLDHAQIDDTDSSMDDDSDIETTAKLSAAKRAREELSFTDGSDDDDDEVLLTYKEEMIQFMLNVHRRKKRVIEEYEKKEAVRNTNTFLVKTKLYLVETCKDEGAPWTNLRKEIWNSFTQQWYAQEKGW